jgi:hypothetical protein
LLRISSGFTDGILGSCRNCRLIETPAASNILPGHLGVPEGGQREDSQKGEK